MACRILPRRLLPFARLLSSSSSSIHLAHHHAVFPRSVHSITPASYSIPTCFSRRFAASADTEKVVKIPTLGESIRDGVIVTLLKKVGDYVQADDVLCTLETAKLTVEIRTPHAGKLISLAAKPGDTIEVDAELARVDTSAPPPPPSATPASTSAPAPSSATSSEPEPKTAPPSSQATTTVLSSSSATSTSSPASTPSSSSTSQIAYTADTLTRSERRVPMSRMRLTIAERLKHSQNTMAMLTTFNEVDMYNLTELRNKYKDEFLKKHKVKLGFMSAFVRAATIALQAYPDVNASIFEKSEKEKEMVYHNYCDVSVAVATPNGLVVPVIRNAEQMSFADIEKTIAALGEKARKNQLAIEDMTGGTFTISNGGVFGSLMGTPIINPPQSAILGMHGVFNRPIAMGDKVVIRPMMYIALTYDHRMIDGATAVRFLKKIKTCIEDPRSMLLDI
eukprot:TRINITY_DN4301_c0_g1_i1.p1 TRINITY_DN4301_c0_g1~~TRINITY_DN4301_c0_g1_i1.p1  ORF type:complete len:450 (-),score=142.10 TRINITY_DN4301_c0_g1_i1:143-1492(-)